MRHVQKVPHQQASVQQVLIAQRIASLGEPGWVDAIAVIDTNTDGVTDNSLALVSVIIANQTGTVTKMGIYSTDGGGGGNVKGKVYDDSWGELGVGAATFPDFTAGYIDITLDGGGFPCTIGQELRVAFIAESSAGVCRYKDGEPANSSYYSFGYTYASGLPSTFLPDGGLTSKYAVRLYIVP